MCCAMQRGCCRPGADSVARPAPRQADLPLPDALRPDAVPHTKMYHVNLSGGPAQPPCLCMGCVRCGVPLSRLPAARRTKQCPPRALPVAAHAACPSPWPPLACSVPLRGGLVGHPAAVPHCAHPPVRGGRRSGWVRGEGADAGVVRLQARQGKARRCPCSWMQKQAWPSKYVPTPQAGGGAHGARHAGRPDVRLGRQDRPLHQPAGARWAHPGWQQELRRPLLGGRARCAPPEALPCPRGPACPCGARRPCVVLPLTPWPCLMPCASPPAAGRRPAARAAAAHDSQRREVLPGGWVGGLREGLKRAVPPGFGTRLPRESQRGRGRSWVHGRPTRCAALVMHRARRAWPTSRQPAMHAR